VPDPQHGPDPSDSHVRHSIEPGHTAAELERIALRAAQAGAVVIRAGADTPEKIGTKTSATDVVTQTDVDSEKAIINVLLAATPDAGVIGEEGGSTNSHARLQWVIDPLDGTVNFMYRIPLFAVSIAAALDGVFVAAAVLDVPSGEVFVAHVNGGARRILPNGTIHPIRSSDCVELSSALVTTGFSYDHQLRTVQASIVAGLIGEVRDVRCFGSAALQLCWVAAGRTDAYFERDIKLWDWAAGSLIARESGVSVELPCPENEDLVFAATPGIGATLRPQLF
jgi:myo-inositol-1(or 4)-monophosphatase